MKSGNKVYIILLTAMVLCLTFFFTTKLWLPDDRTTQKQYYDELFSLGSWNIHVGNAKYDKAQTTLTCKVYQKGVLDSPKAYKIAVFLGKSTLEKSLPYTINTYKDDPNFVYLTVRNVPSNYYYVTVQFTAQESQDTSTSNTEYDSSSDNYGDDTTSSAVTETDTKDVRIDYRIASSASSTAKAINSSSKS